MKKFFTVVLMCLLMVAGALALDDACTKTVAFSVSISFDNNVTFFPATQLQIVNNCTSVGGLSTGVEWLDPVVLSLGNITADEVIINKNQIFVDSVARPDLDQAAKLTFTQVGFVAEPAILRDGVPCTLCANTTFNSKTGVLTTVVPGFSNYTLTGRQDFTVNSDPKAELADKVYQTIDLGDSYRNSNFTCITQIYGISAEDGSSVLVQTNPERKVEARILGNPDQNLPESRGYFSPVHGIANVYYNGATLAGYQNFDYVAVCANETAKLIYEEPISTRYSPIGRSIQGRSLWLTEGSNANYLIFGAVLIIIAVLLLIKMYRTMRGK